MSLPVGDDSCLSGSGCTPPDGSPETQTQCGMRHTEKTDEDEVWAYSQKRLLAKLDSIPMEGRNIEDVTDSVKEACREEGVILSISDTKRSKDGERRLVGRHLRCKHGMRNRQNGGSAKDEGTAPKKKLRTSQRIGCPFLVAIRWPETGKRKECPWLTDALDLRHNHPVHNMLPHRKPKAYPDRAIMDQPANPKGSMSSAGVETKVGDFGGTVKVSEEEEEEEEREQEEEQEPEEGQEERARLGKRKLGSMAKALCRHSAWTASSGQPNDGAPSKHQRKASAPGTMGSGTAAIHETVSWLTTTMLSGIWLYNAAIVRQIWQQEGGVLLPACAAGDG
ncbi:unnamed protein product [Ectocarpus sp. 6 AP-2014]